MSMHVMGHTSGIWWMAMSFFSSKTATANMFSCFTR